ncbi:MAG: hypothetical protein DIU79_08050 [Actinobacteria bacterium]|nr:MAG: hypothetical protein DIU79_08050 [Actinomycetota bacterium]
MAVKSQPRGAKGTIGHPYSALNLRLVLATFGLISSTVLGVLAARAHVIPLAVILFALAAIAAVDFVIVQLRRAARRREQPGRRYSLFE